MAVRINSAYDAAKYYASRATKSTPSKATSNTVKSSSSIRSSSKTNVSRDVKITSKNATSATNNKKSASAVSNAATAIKSTKNNNTKTNVSVTIPVLNIAKAVTSTVTKAAKTVTGKAANSTTKTSAKTNVANTTSARKAAVASNTASMKSSSTTKSTVSTAYTAPTKATNVTKTVAPILNVVNTVTNRAKAAISSSKKNVATTSVPTNVGKAMAVSTTKTSNAGTKVSVSANATVSSNGQAKKLSVQGAIAKKAGVPTDSNGNPYINNKTDAEKYSKALIAYNKSKNKTAYFAGIATSSTGEPRINSAADAKAYTSALSSITSSKATNGNYFNLELPSATGVGYGREYDVLLGKTFDPIQSMYDCNQKKIRDIYESGSGTVYADNKGYLRVKIAETAQNNDPYGIALGTYYGKTAHSLDVGDKDGYGAIFKIEFEDGTYINATLMDVKADIHTDPTNRYYDENNSAKTGGGSHFLEFVVDSDALNANDKELGVMGVLGGSFPSKVSNISVRTDKQIEWPFL